MTLLCDLHKFPKLNVDTDTSSLFKWYLFHFILIVVTHAPSNPGSAVSSPKVGPKSPRSPRGRLALKAIDMDVKGNKLTFYPPDSYNDNMVNTDPPQLRLKLEWV